MDYRKSYYRKLVTQNGFNQGINCDEPVHNTWASDEFAADFSKNPPADTGDDSISNAFTSTQSSTLNGIVFICFLTLLVSIVMLILNYRKRVTNLEAAINRMRYESRSPGSNGNR